MKEKNHEKLKKAQVFIAAALLLILTILLFKNTDITSYVSADFRSQEFNLIMDKSQEFLLKTNSAEPMLISSFRLSGSIAGHGSIEIYIEDNGKRFLVFKNIREKEKGLPSITGLAVASAAENQTPEEVPKSQEKSLIISPLNAIEWKNEISLSKDEEFMAGNFNSKCIDTCFIEMPVSSEKTYKLIFLVQPGTKLQLSRIIYTLKMQ